MFLVVLKAVTKDAALLKLRSDGPTLRQLPSPHHVIHTAPTRNLRALDFQGALTLRASPADFAWSTCRRLIHRGHMKGGSTLPGDTVGGQEKTGDCAI